MAEREMAADAFVGATLIDGTGSAPLPDSAVVVADGRITWVGPASKMDRTGDIRVIDVATKHIIPGLMDANVHLFAQFDPEIVLKYEPGDYDELVLEAAQVALRVGITTVFDTWGPLESLRRVRDRINAGEVSGSRIFFAGNIIGNDGPWSVDNAGKGYGESLNPTVVASINRHWEQGVGGDLPWMSADDVREIVREYIETSGIDFVKYASSVHKDLKFITFSPDTQRAIVEEAHDAGMTAQACTITPEALKLAIDAGVDLLQHGDITGRHTMPSQTLDLIVERQLPCAAFLTTERFIAAVRENPQGFGEVVLAKHENDQNLIRAGAKLLLADDAVLWGPTANESPAWGHIIRWPDFYMQLGSSHILWLRAAFEQQMTPMDALLSSTRNIAEAYGKSSELGTIEPGKRADLLVLDADPLADVENYGRIAHVVKDGRVVDHERLPDHPVLTRELQA